MKKRMEERAEEHVEELVEKRAEESEGAGSVSVDVEESAEGLVEERTGKRAGGVGIKERAEESVEELVEERAGEGACGVGMKERAGEGERAGDVRVKERAGTVRVKERAGSVDIEKLVECEFERFTKNFYRGRSDAPEFEIVEGTVAVLISAPHAVTHMRRNKILPSDDFTGSIALAAARAGGCHAIVATRTGSGDPNWDPLEKCAYKQALCAYVRERGIRFVLDLHGMVAASPALVALGSADGETVVAAPGLDERIADLLHGRLSPWVERFGKPIILNGRLSARRESTVARTVARECGIPALQMEVATQLRVPVRFNGRIPKGEELPKGERNPFTGTQLPIEIEARRAADPAAVSALIDALVEVVASA